MEFHPLPSDPRIRHLLRTYAVLSGINQLIVRERDPETLLRAACSIAVEKGGFLMAWIGLVDADGSRVSPRAFAGVVDGYLDAVDIDLTDRARSAGPTATAVRTGVHQVCNDLATDPSFEPWRRSAHARGYRSAGAFPIVVAGRVIGTFNLYSGEAGFFDEEECRLLDEMAMDVGFALDVSRRDAEGTAAAERISRQRATLIELARLGPAASDPILALQRIAEAAANTLQVERVSFWRYTTDRSAIACVERFERTTGRHSSGAMLEAAAYPAYFRALAGAEIIAAHDALTDPRTREFTDGYLRPLGITSMLDVPIRVGGERDGVLCHEQVGTARTWTDDEQTFAVAMASLVSLTLEAGERRLLEAQLRQSQKMEAIGQLAGGIAHDFNNILATIIMQAELTAMGELPGDSREGIAQIRAAAERAANLTRQLLLFSRRQVMQPRELDLNEIVAHLARMLQRIIGEDVTLQLHLHGAPVVTRADAGMLDQVLMNLAVNARDAMPAGGSLLIATSQRHLRQDRTSLDPDAVAGSYVCLRIADTGCGIGPDVLPRIFEPFFTTKPRDKGTGLGLATVFGIVKQHRGWIEVESREGEGTSFMIYLPAAPEPAVVASDPPRVPDQRGGDETILLAEDDPSVRALIRSTLAGQGYRVLEAANGADALACWSRHRDEIALLLTDLVMPGGMSGQQLAERLQQEVPALPVVFTSGYSAEIAGRELILKAGENFVQKPFPPSQLLMVVRRSLDG